MLKGRDRCIGGSDGPVPDSSGMSLPLSIQSRPKDSLSHFSPFPYLHLVFPVRFGYPTYDTVPPHYFVHGFSASIYIRQATPYALA